MPPKKKGGSKKKAGKKEGDEEETLDAGMQNTFLMREQEALKFKLVMQTNKASGAEAVVRELRTRLLDLTQLYEKEKGNTFDIVADMTREYKAMKEEMLKKISDLESKNMQYKDKLAAARRELDDMVRQKDREIQQKDNAITEMKTKMDEMAKEFGQMLKQTLDKMSEKIVITNDYSNEAQQENPVVRTFEDFNLGSTYS